MFNINHSKTEAGMRVITAPMPALKSITALLMVNTGSRYEENEEQGAAHLLEHLVFKGTKNYPDGLKLSIALDGIGASSNAFTSKEYTGFYVTAASSHLTYCLEILRELVFFPLIRPADVDQEKSVVIEEIKMHRDSPEDFISDEFEQAVYHGSSLSHPISGTIKSVQQQSAATLRSFLQKWYGLENLTLVIAGDESKLRKRDLLDKVQNIFNHQDSLANRSNHHRQRREKFLQENPISNKKKLNLHRSTEQAHVILGWPALKRDDPQRYVLTVLSTIMGGNRSSRLFYAVREQANLAYYIYADVDQYHDGGMLTVSAGLNLEKKEEGIGLIADQFMQMMDGSQPVTEEELRRAKDYLTGRIYLGLESSRSVAQHYGLTRLLLNRVEDPQDVIDGIRKVSLKDLDQLAKGIVKPEEMRLAVIGPDL